MASTAAVRRMSDKYLDRSLRRNVSRKYKSENNSRRGTYESSPVINCLPSKCFQPISPSNAAEPILRFNSTINSTIEDEINELKNRLKIPFYIIEPESKFLYRWNLFMMIVLVYTSLLTPYEIAFYPVQSDSFFWLDCSVNLAFVLDIFIHFFSSFHQQNNQMQQEHVTSLRRIGKRYLRSYFLVDLVAALPVMMVPLFTKAGRHAKYASLKVVRLAQLTRAFSLMRMLKAGRMCQKFEQHFYISYSIKALAKYTCLILLAGHWVACIWGATAHMSDSYEDSWISSYCPDSDCTISSLLEIHFELYTASLYFSIMTITSIGYGNIVPVNILEHWVCILIMLCGASLWAYTIGNASSIIATMGSDTAEYNRLLDILDRYLIDQGYPAEIKKELRQYFQAYKSLALKQISSEVVEHMSPRLQHMVARWQGKWTYRVRWMQVLSKNMVTTMVTNMDNYLYCKNEIMPSHNSLCTIASGVASRVGRVLVHGSCWGHDMILSNPLLMKRSPVKAITFCEVACITRKVFFELLEEFPEDLKKIRKWAGYIALQRALQLLALSSRLNFQINTKVIKESELTSKTPNTEELDKYAALLNNIRCEPCDQLPHYLIKEDCFGGCVAETSDTTSLLLLPATHQHNEYFEAEFHKEISGLKQCALRTNELAERNQNTLEEIKAILSGPFS